jgi:hypothetical protein
MFGRAGGSGDPPCLPVRRPSPHGGILPSRGPAAAGRIPGTCIQGAAKILLAPLPTLVRPVPQVVVACPRIDMGDAVPGAVGGQVADETAAGILPAAIPSAVPPVQEMVAAPWTKTLWPSFPTMWAASPSCIKGLGRGSSPTLQPECRLSTPRAIQQERSILAEDYFQIQASPPLSMRCEQDT